MLKYFFLNQKKIPVPVPIRTLSEAISWVEKHILTQGRVITKIQLDGQLVEVKDGKTYQLTENSRLDLKVDTPIELAIQTIDALRNLSNMMQKDLKQFAVTSWQSGSKKPVFYDDFEYDLGLMLDLLDHTVVLLTGVCETKNCQNCITELSKVHVALKMAASHSDWKGFARLLLSTLDPKIQELCEELSHLQKLVFEIQAERRYKVRSEQAGPAIAAGPR